MNFVDTASAEELPGSAGVSPAIPIKGDLLPAKQWKSRGYLPHFDQPGLVQFITLRLKDTVPVALLQRWKSELNWVKGLPSEDIRAVELRKRIDCYEDAGHGLCQLRNSFIAELIENSLIYFDGQRYRLLAWCIMPNHVHCLFETIPGHPLDKLVHSWKSFTGKKANKILGQSGVFWMKDYYDRFVRDYAHFANVVNYIHQNPVKAGLIRKAVDWRWSSAARVETVGFDYAGGTPALPGRRK